MIAAMVGQTVSHYRILEKLGEGGMGVVYKAEDVRLNRFVALKFLSANLGSEPEQRQRFIHEAKAASALEHPNICTIHEIDETPAGQMFIAMAYLEGETLKTKIERGPLPVREALDLSMQVARGLTKAHERGIIHRDIKPANVIVTDDGVAKIVDFGLAKLAGATELTRTGTTLGTAAYMSPEQVQGISADRRVDVWALGVVLYETLTGRRPFRGDHMPAIVYSIVNEKPAPIRQDRPDLPVALESVVARALEKDRELRYPSAGEILRDLTAYQATLSAPGPSAPTLQMILQPLRRPRVALPAFALLIVAALVAGWFWWRASRIRWATDQALPEISRLIETGSYVAAFDLARQAEQSIPQDTRLAKLWPDMSREVSVETTPPGAEVYLKEYTAVEGDWRHLGRSAVNKVRIPLGFFRWRVVREGYETVETGDPGAGLAVRFLLHQAGAAPPGMAYVPAGAFRMILAHFGHLGPLPLGEYWIDKYEVTNRKFKEFVDRRGYQQREYWKHPFTKDGRALSWDQAMALLRDSTGRPGPATWEAGVYPDGKDEFPVTGVSWYEAAAYAEFAGKQLPSFYHWYQAARPAAAPYLIPLSNFGGAGPARAGAQHAAGPYGTDDMAGNVREWAWNEVGNERFILGGAFNQPAYLFHWPDSRPPLDRSPLNGFRCVKYLAAVPAGQLGPLRRQFRDYSKEKPASEEVFRIFKSMYEREPAPLDAQVEPTDDRSEHWTRQKISFQAGNERMAAHLFLPRNAQPPVPAVVYFPGSSTLFLRSSENLAGWPRMDFIVKSGRAMLFPVFKGTYERHAGLIPLQQNRELMAQWVKDLGASIDYLESRPEIDRNRIGYLGTSMGARLGGVFAALEGRLKVAVLLDGGLTFAPRAPEVDEMNFVPRVKLPVLMVSGQFDFIYPPETSQLPFFRLLGTTEKDKKRIVLDTAHDVMLLRSQAGREVLDWLDRYLGPAR